jgi:Domain of unknown function (DUF4292)
MKKSFMNKFIFCICLLYSIGSTGCKSSKKSTNSTTNVVDKSMSLTKVFSEIEKNKFTYTWISGTADIDYKGKPMNISLSSTIRIKKDSILWMNFKKFGFDVARIKITKDSFFVLNYFNSEYLAKDLKYIEQKFNIPADLGKIQDMMVGNILLLSDKKKYSLTSDMNNLFLKDSISTMQSNLTINTDYRPTEMYFEDKTLNRKIKTTCSGHEKAQNERLFSYLRAFEVYTPESGNVSAKIEIDKDLEIDVPKATKFEIPSDYRKIDRF